MKTRPISEDGYFRCTVNELLGVEFTHLETDIYHPQTPALKDFDRITSIEGYTEWVSHLGCSLSLGWDWQLSYREKTVQYLIINEPFSNIQLIEDNGDDIPASKNLALLKTFVNSMGWGCVVESTLRQRYS